jgi:hypothetical protein
MCPALTPAAFGAASCPAADIAKAAARRKTDAILEFIAGTLLGITSQRKVSPQKAVHLNATTEFSLLAQGLDNSGLDGPFPDCLPAFSWWIGPDLRAINGFLRKLSIQWKTSTFFVDAIERSRHQGL